MPDLSVKRYRVKFKEPLKVLIEGHSAVFGGPNQPLPDLSTEKYVQPLESRIVSSGLNLSSEGVIALPTDESECFKNALA